MKKILITFLIVLGFIIAVPLSSMAGNHYGHGKHHHGYKYNYSPYVEGNIYYRPYDRERYIYYAPPPPPPVVYYEPAPYTGPYYYAPSGGSLFFGINFD